MVITTVVVNVGPEQVVPELEKVGFDDVKIWFSASELPDDWPENKRSDVSDFGETQVWLEGTWTGRDGVEMPSRGDQWVAYDVWEKLDASSGESYGKSKTTLGKAVYVGAWGLGIFLVGLPILLAATWKEK